MEPAIRDAIWSQYGASIDFLRHNIEVCPDALWTAELWKSEADFPPEMAQFWYVAYHTLFWIDCYLTGTEEGFLPPEPFLLIEQHWKGPIPERVYSKDEVLGYLALCRERAFSTIDVLTEERAATMCHFGWGSCTFFELLLYTMRHTAGHTAQMNMLLGQVVGPQESWQAQASK